MIFFRTMIPSILMIGMQIIDILKIGKKGQKSLNFMVFLLGGLSESDLQIKQHLLQTKQGILDNFIGVLMDCLHPHFQSVIKRVHLPVACKFDLLVLQQVNAHQVANCVVLHSYAVSSAVRHFWVLLDPYTLLVESFYVLLAQPHAVVFAHLLLLQCRQQYQYAEAQKKRQKMQKIVDISTLFNLLQFCLSLQQVLIGRKSQMQVVHDMILRRLPINSKIN